MLQDSATTFQLQNELRPFPSFEEKPTERFKSSGEIAREVAHELIEIEQQNAYKSGHPKEKNYPQWLLFVFLIAFLGIAYARSTYRKRFSLLMKTLIHWKVAKQIMRFEKVYIHPVNLILNANFLFSLSLFFSFSFLITEHDEFNLLNVFPVILAFLVSFIILKLLLYKFSEWLFDVNEVIEDYIFQANLFNKFLGVLFLGLNIFILFSTFSTTLLVKIGFFSLLIIYAIQLFRGLNVGVHHHAKWYLIILYLCTLEILPILLLIKWVKSSY